MEIKEYVPGHNTSGAEYYCTKHKKSVLAEKVKNFLGCMAGISILLAAYVAVAYIETIGF